MKKKLFVFGSILLLSIGAISTGISCMPDALNFGAQANEIYSCTLKWDERNKPDLSTFTSVASRVQLAYSNDIENMEGQHVALHNNSFIQTSGIAYNNELGGYTNNLSKIALDFDNTNGILLIDVWHKNETTNVESEKETYFVTQSGEVSFNQLATKQMPNQFKIYRAKNGSNIDNIITIKSLTVICNPIMVPVPIPTPNPETIGEKTYKDYFTDKEFKDTLNLPIDKPINQALNYMRLNRNDVAIHFPNLFCGLLKTNEYGVLEKDLATSVKQTNMESFEINIKDNVPWMLYDGERQYSPLINGVETPQYVSASDFVTAAKNALCFQNGSQISYLYTAYIKGAVEYNKFTYLSHMVEVGGNRWGMYKNVKRFTEKLNELISNESGQPSNIPATEEALKAIRDFENVGVKASNATSNGGGTITYTLTKPNINFVDLLSQPAFYPANEIFLNEVRFPSFGRTIDKLLYNGPFILENSNDMRISYIKNKKYHDADSVTINKVNFYVLDQTNPESGRSLFEDGTLDMFEINKNDTAGYEKYITGPNKDHDETNPISDKVFLSNMHQNKNINIFSFSKSRLIDGQSQSYATHSSNELTNGDGAQISNATRALKINEVRKHIINSIDLDNAGYDDDRELINTLLPEDAFFDNNNADYTTNYYYKEFAKTYNKDHGTNLTFDGKGSDVDNLLKPNQFYNHDILQTRQEAIKAVNYYNEKALAEGIEGITYPIQLEMFCKWTYDEDQKYYSQLILDMNQKLNNMPNTTYFDRNIAQLNQKTNTGGFLIIPTYNITVTNWDSIYAGGHFDISIEEQFLVDINSPMSILRNFISDTPFGLAGCAVSGMENTYRLNETKNNIVPDNVSEKLQDLYMIADAENESLELRNQKCAELENALINEFNITKPLTTNKTNRLVVSNIVGYHKNSSVYSIQANNLSRLGVLTTPLTKQERQLADNLYNAKKIEYIKMHGLYNIY